MNLSKFFYGHQLKLLITSYFQGQVENLSLEERSLDDRIRSTVTHGAARLYP